MEVPIGDFFCNGWGVFSQVDSLPVAVNSHGGFNSYWPMPFRGAARITVENLGDQEARLYYQVDYTLTEVPSDAAYFHAQWWRSNPLPYKEDHTLLDGIAGSGLSWLLSPSRVIRWQPRGERARIWLRME